MNPITAKRILAVAAFVITLLALLAVIPYNPAIAIAVLLLAAACLF